MKQVLLIAILLQAPQPATFKISGRVVTVPNASEMPSTLLLRSLQQAPGTGRTVGINRDGTFEVVGVAPGEYDLNLVDSARSGQGANSVGPGRNFTFRGGDVTDFEIKVPTRVPGKIIMADGATLPGNGFVIASSTPVTAVNANSSRRMRSAAVPGPTGDFALPVYANENSVSIENLPAGYFVKSMTYGEVDLQTGPLRLTGPPVSTILITLDRSIR